MQKTAEVDTIEGEIEKYAKAIALSWSAAAKKKPITRDMLTGITSELIRRFSNPPLDGAAAQKDKRPKILALEKVDQIWSAMRSERDLKPVEHPAGNLRFQADPCKRRIASERDNHAKLYRTLAEIVLRHR